MPLGSLSSDVFERRTSSGSEPFPLLISLDATVFILPSVLILTETICPKTCSKSRLKSAKRAFPVDVRRSKTSLLKLPILFLSPPQGNWSPEHAASPPTNVVRVVFKSWYSVYRLVSLSSYAGASWDFQRKSQRKGSREGPLRPLPRLKRKGLTKRSNTKLIFVFYFLSHNLFIKFIIILLQFQETRR